MPPPHPAVRRASGTPADARHSRFGFAPPPAELAASGFDCLASAFCPRSGNRAGLKALDLLDPLPTAELDRSRRELFLPRLTHAGSIGRSELIPRPGLGAEPAGSTSL